jgi:hypothetical protein
MIFVFLSQREVVNIVSMLFCSHFNIQNRSNGSIMTFAIDNPQIFLDWKEVDLVYIG